MNAPTIQDLISKAKAYLPSLNEERVRRAFNFAEDAHRGQTRFSGEPYIVHPLNVADILLEFHPDEDTIIAALLHDVVEDTDHTLEEIEKLFGGDVRNLCWGMEKLSKVKSKLNDPQVDNLRKLFLAMANDFRVVLLKLCDRLHNMRTLEHVRPEKRMRIAQETLNIYAPIAARLGIYRLKSHLEDLCFLNLQPEDYQNILAQLEKTGKWRERYIDSARKILLETLSREGIQAKADGRVKSVYSIFRKLQKKNKTSLDEIFDVFAMRIILPDIYKHGNEYFGHLYTALGIIHNHFTPLANRFKDYIAVPKVNGYRSLHTTVMGLGPKAYTQPTEIQFRTEGMHQSAELGIAAHWMYEEHGSEWVSESAPPTFEAAVANSAAPNLKKQKDWISGLRKIEQEIHGNKELLESLKVDIFQDRIFVLTPRGDVRDLPAGATTIDFAYAVHTEIGNHCLGAKVNGTMVPLDHELKSGDVVEIVTRKNVKPNQHWLSFVKTNHARNRVRAYFRDFDDDKNLRTGRDLMNVKLKQLGFPPLNDSLSVLRHYGGEELSLHGREDILKEVGRGGMLPSHVVRKIFTLEEILGIRKGKAKGLGSAPKKAEPILASELIIGNERNLPAHFVQCCDAESGGDLVGYVTRGRGVSIHLRDCSIVKNTADARLVPVRLSRSGALYPVQVKIEASDRIGLVRDISNAIAESGINIVDIFHEPPSDGHVEIQFVLEIGDFDQFERVISKLEKVPSVRRASRIN